MKTIVLCLSVILLCSSLFSQPYNIGHRESYYTDFSRSNRKVMFEVYYPASKTADNVSVIGNGKKFPVVIFGHGYQLTYSDYLWLKDSLVPKGYFVVFPRTEEKLFPSHTDFAKDLAFLVNSYKSKNEVSGNWYYGRLSNYFAVAGHSMGGGCSLLSIQYSANINAVFNFAAAETNPSAIAACTGIAIPALIYAGGKDCIAPPSSNQIPMYNNIQNVCKTYIQITNTRHCQWADNNGTCRLGELFCSPFTTSPTATFKTTFSLLLPWLNDKLNVNKTDASKFQSLLTSTSGITYQQSCNAGGFVKTEDNNSNNIEQLKVYPSVLPAGTLINISLPKMQQPNLLQVFNQSGKIILSKDIRQYSNQTMQVSSANFQKGIYFVVVSDGKLQYKSSFMIEAY